MMQPVRSILYHPKTLFLLSLFAVFRLVAFLSNSEAIHEISLRKEPHRVEVTLRSAETALNRGTFLLVEQDGRLIPFETLSSVPDLGVPFIMDAAAALFKIRIDRITLLKFNAALNAASLLLLFFVLVRRGWRLLAAAVALLGPAYFIPGPWPSADIFASFIGYYGFVLSAVILFDEFLDRIPAGPGRFLLGALPSVLLVALTVFLRQPIGLIGVLIMIAMLAYRGISTRKNLPLYATLAVVTFGASLVPDVAIALRNKIYRVDSGDAMVKKGMSYSFYLGLGIPGNPFGIVLDDHFGRTLIEERNLDLEFMSRRFYRYFGREYVSLVWNNKVVVLKIYYQKLRMCLGYLGLPAWEIALAILCLFLKSRDPAMRMAKLATIAAFLILAQGVLVIPGFPYVYPAAFGLTFVWACYLDGFYRLNKTVFAMGFLFLMMTVLFSTFVQPTYDASYYLQKSIWLVARAATATFLFCAIALVYYRDRRNPPSRLSA